MKTVAVVFGTRPEAIKLCPVILAMRNDGEMRPVVCVTAQHRQMLDQTLRVFGVSPDADLDLMRPNQTLAEITSRAVSAVHDFLAAAVPDFLLVQGDTTTTFCAALAAFYRRIPVGHVEAGLRTGNKMAPYPEEINRLLTSRIADHHFAPTERAAQNLLADGIPERSILVTGNTVVDALNFAVERARRERPEIPGFGESMMRNDRQLVLVTGHRRESFGDGFESICSAIRDLANTFPGTYFVYPVHLNPNVREPVFRVLDGLPNVLLLDPLEYLPFVRLMDRSTLILTDSGGVQEEAPSLGKPVLVMRDFTERTESIEAGASRLVGTRRKEIVDRVAELLTDHGLRRSMAAVGNPYGDGKASGRIVQALKAYPGRH